MLCFVPSPIHGEGQGEVRFMEHALELKFVSRKLRRSQTPWETKLWQCLRGGRLHGLKFKRQVPMGSFVVDFCCQEKKVVVELDGGGHSETDVIKKDITKQKFLETHGYTILRFWNNEVDTNMDGVIQVILKSCGLTSP